MSPTVIIPAAVTFVPSASTPDTFALPFAAIVIASVDGEFTVKRLRRDRDGVRLEAENPKYAPIRFSGDEECRIFGVVTGLVRRLG